MCTTYTADDIIQICKLFAVILSLAGSEYTSRATNLFRYKGFTMWLVSDTLLIIYFMYDLDVGLLIMYTYFLAKAIQGRHNNIDNDTK